MATIELIRTAEIEDIAMILDIYSYYVNNTTITFEIIPPAVEEMNRRVMETVKNSDWIVYEYNKAIVGYAYYSKFRERKAYDYSCETTIYVHKDFTGKGIGSALYGQLISNLKKTSKAVATYPFSRCIYFETSQGLH
ncbi:MAG: N-acetyltransferase [Fibrobacter sp.]|nr:N-acetyltransferase [Fibrobacter sp.]